MVPEQTPTKLQRAARCGDSSKLQSSELQLRHERCEHRFMMGTQALDRNGNGWIYNVYVLCALSVLLLLFLLRLVFAPCSCVSVLLLLLLLLLVFAPCSCVSALLLLFMLLLLFAPWSCVSVLLLLFLLRLVFALCSYARTVLTPKKLKGWPDSNISYKSHVA